LRVGAGDEKLPFGLRVQKIHNVIFNVPPSKMPLLKYLIDFLRSVEMHSAVNKMTVAYVFWFSLSLSLSR